MVRCCLLMMDLKIFKLDLAGSADTLESNCGRAQAIAQGYF